MLQWYRSPMIGRISLAVTALLLCSAATTVRPDRSGPVLLDGNCDDPSWRKARAVRLGESGALLRMIADRQFVWLCIEAPPQSYASVDVYVSDATKGVTNLHASAKLGERVRGSGGFPAWKWWNHRGWSANITPLAGVTLEGGQVSANFLTVRGREFQIARSKFPGRSWRMMIEAEALGKDNASARFPADADPDTPSSWAIVTL